MKEPDELRDTWLGLGRGIVLGVVVWAILIFLAAKLVK